jgi:predicted RNase H-like HicB family nuclease
MGARFRPEKRPKALLFPVIAGLDPAIHAALAPARAVKMISCYCCRKSRPTIRPRETQQRAQAGRAEGAEVMRYAIVIEKAESNYSAYVPDLPGCVATAATVSEVESEIAALFLSHAADYFLKDGGHLAFVMPRSFFTGDQHDNKLQHRYHSRFNARPHCNLVAFREMRNVANLYFAPVLISRQIDSDSRSHKLFYHLNYL